MKFIQVVGECEHIETIFEPELFISVDNTYYCPWCKERKKILKTKV